VEIALAGAKRWGIARAALRKRLVLQPQPANPACRTLGVLPKTRNRLGRPTHLLRTIRHRGFEQLVLSAGVFLLGAQREPFGKLRAGDDAGFKMKL
jgi:hypothetical protein